MSNVVAIRVDGVWLSPASQQQDKHDVVDASKDEITQIVEHLASVIRLAHGLGEADRRRVREFIHATSGALTAATYLAAGDQSLFEQALKGR